MESAGEGNNNGDNDDMWGDDVNTYEPVNLIQHVQQGGVGFDDEWNVASEHTIEALVQKKRHGGKKGGKQSGKKRDVIRHHGLPLWPDRSQAN